MASSTIKSSFGTKIGTMDVDGVWSNVKAYGIYYAVIPFPEANQFSISVNNIETYSGTTTLHPTVTITSRRKNAFVIQTSEEVGGMFLSASITVA